MIRNKKTFQYCPNVWTLPSNCLIRTSNLYNGDRILLDRNNDNTKPCSKQYTILLFWLPINLDYPTKGCPSKNFPCRQQGCMWHCTACLQIHGLLNKVMIPYKKFVHKPFVVYELRLFIVELFKVESYLILN